MRLSYCDTDTSSTAMSISGSVPIASAASNAFSMNSRSVVYSDFPAFSNPAMPLLSWKNSAGDFCVRFLSPFAFGFVAFFAGIVRNARALPSRRLSFAFAPARASLSRASLAPFELSLSSTVQTDEIYHERRAYKTTRRRYVYRRGGGNEHLHI